MGVAQGHVRPLVMRNGDVLIVVAIVATAAWYVGQEGRKVERVVETKIVEKVVERERVVERTVASPPVSVQMFRDVGNGFAITGGYVARNVRPHGGIGVREG